MKHDFKYFVLFCKDNHQTPKMFCLVDPWGYFWSFFWLHLMPFTMATSFNQLQHRNNNDEESVFSDCRGYLTQSSACWRTLIELKLGKPHSNSIVHLHWSELICTIFVALSNCATPWKGPVYPPPPFSPSFSPIKFKIVKVLNVYGLFTLSLICFHEL